jgi:uncharacterized protein DUF4440
MRAFLICVAAAALLPVGALSAQSASLVADSVDVATRAQLEAARNAVWRAWFAADSSTLSKLLPAALAAGSSGGWENRESTLASARGFVDAGGQLVDIRFDSTNIRVRGNVAILQSRYTLVLEQGGTRSTRHGIATEVFVRDRGRWTNPFWYLE